MASAAAMAPSDRLPDSGSASTGQPNVSASPATPAAFARCDQGPPAMIIPLPRSGCGFDRGRARPTVIDDDFRALTRRKRSCGADQRFAELEIQVDRAGAVGPAHGFLEGPDGEGPRSGFLALDGDAGR